MTIWILHTAGQAPPAALEQALAGAAAPLRREEDTAQALDAALQAAKQGDWVLWLGGGGPWLAQASQKAAQAAGCPVKQSRQLRERAQGMGLGPDGCAQAACLPAGSRVFLEQGRPLPAFGLPVGDGWLVAAPAGFGGWGRALSWLQGQPCSQAALPPGAALPAGEAAAPEGCPQGPAIPPAVPPEASAPPGPAAPAGEEGPGVPPAGREDDALVPGFPPPGKNARAARFLTEPVPPAGTAPRGRGLRLAWAAGLALCLLAGAACWGLWQARQAQMVQAPADEAAEEEEWQLAEVIDESGDINGEVTEEGGLPIPAADPQGEDASQPEASAPEPSQPEASAPEPSQPEASAPEPSQPETPAPESSQPEASAPEPSQPAASAPEPSQLETPAPEPSQPEASAPESSQPEDWQPEPSPPPLESTDTWQTAQVIDESDGEEEPEPAPEDPEQAPDEEPPPEEEPEEEGSSTDSSGGEEALRQQTLYYASGGQTRQMNAFDLLCCVVQNEMGGSLHDEALKAQAVAAYTFIRYNNQQGVAPALSLSTRVNQRVVDAVAAVAGQALYYNGALANAVFHSTSCGATTSAQSVWGRAVPYLVSVDSQWDSASPYYNGSYSISAADLSSRIWEVYGIDVDGLDYDEWIVVDESRLAPGGYVGSVYVGGYDRGQGGSAGSDAITGRSIREKLLGFSLRSTCFEVSWSGEVCTFTTRGYGHGVGMSQYGAHLMAQSGYSYDEILAHYYPGTQLG